MHIITLTSDWNEQDYYIAALKGKLLSGCPEAQIVDINHNIKVFNTAEAAFIIRNSYPHFPDNTIHIIAVNTEPVEDRGLLAARKDNQFFICADNGVLGLLAGNEPEQVVRLEESEGGPEGSFIALAVFARAACALSEGSPLSAIGKPTEDYNRQTPLRATIEENIIIGSVIHLDSYQNAITNISKELFDRVGNGRSFEIFVQTKHYMIDQISQRYSDALPGDLLALFNSSNLLEIAMRNGNAAGLLRLSTNSTIRVEFK